MRRDLRPALPPALDSNVNDPGATVAGPLLLPAFLVPVWWRRRDPGAATWVFGAACVRQRDPDLPPIPTAGGHSHCAARALPACGPLHAVESDHRPSGRGRRAGFRRRDRIGGPRGRGCFQHGRLLTAPVPRSLGSRQAREIAGAGCKNELRERSEQLRRQREATAQPPSRWTGRGSPPIWIWPCAPGCRRCSTWRRWTTPIRRPGARGSPESSSRLRVARRDACAARPTAKRRSRRADPRPTLEQLDALLAEARAGGRVVDLEIEGSTTTGRGHRAGRLPDGAARAGGSRRRHSAVREGAGSLLARSARTRDRRRASRWKRSGRRHARRTRARDVVRRALQRRGAHAREPRTARATASCRSMPEPRRIRLPSVGPRTELALLFTMLAAALAEQFGRSDTEHSLRALVWILAAWIPRLARRSHAAAATCVAAAAIVAAPDMKGHFPPAALELLLPPILAYSAWRSRAVAIRPRSHRGARGGDSDPRRVLGVPERRNRDRHPSAVVVRCRGAEAPTTGG